MYRKGPLARMRALFFCVIVSTFGLLAIAFAVSCSHTAGNSETVHTAFKSDASAEETAEPATGSENVSFFRKRQTGQQLEELELELAKIGSERNSLKEENDWLRSEVIKLHQALADANQTIYSLNRKLDAIFKPDVPGE